jgi:hypothetical protein
MEEACLYCFPHLDMTCFPCHKEKVDAAYRNPHNHALETEDANGPPEPGWEWTRACTLDKEDQKCNVILEPDTVLRLPLFMVVDEKKLIAVLRAQQHRLPDDIKIIWGTSLIPGAGQASRGFTIVGRDRFDRPQEVVVVVRHGRVVMAMAHRP